MALHVLLASGLTDIYIIIRPEDQVNWISNELITNEALHIVRSQDAALGMSYSLRCGLEAAIDDTTTAVLVVLSDQPFINEEIVRELLSTIHNQPGLDYVASTSGEGALTPPVVLSHSMFGAIEQLQGDVGARKLLALPQYQGTSVCCEDPQLLYDVDDQEDWLHAVEYYSKLYL